ncbi:DNA repair protein Sae2/CtIP [Penicillium bovifimosum]|uniref:DNA repair protein Sae2/CtIP n=1 Tax=Penicillium bovifimosum TaxID=126998 RepID=A0A9W9HEY3_9EURO|nr:DNA repair protein Sae2/CtIP [Penicillium bovifimosum]KAJ5145657.1 DNA repair protein Sae2/CtIP [Penicillium bovifimosum]
MEVIKELHAAVAVACEASFDNAYKQMKSHLGSHAKETGVKQALARQSQLQTETRIRELQDDIAILQSELQQYEVDPRDLELPKEYANLESEFDPKNLWGSDLDDDHCDVQKSRKRVEAKYTALYTNLQTFIQTWSGLKTRILQHKMKLRRWEQQLECEEFSLVLNGKRVKFRRVLSPISDEFDEGHSQTIQGSSRKRPRAECSTPPDKATKLSHKGSCASEVDTAVKLEDDQTPTRAPTPEPASTQSSSPRSEVEPSRFPAPIRPQANVCLQQTRQGLSPIPVRNSGHTQPDMSSERPAVVKNELLSSSPLRTSIHHSEQPFVSTQDLDEIGDKIQTPMKRKAHRDIQVANTLETDNSTNNACRSKRIWNKLPVQRGSILQPVDGNARITTSAQGSSTKCLEYLERRAIPALAEDGEDQRSSKFSPGVNLGPSNTKTNSGCAQRRLEDLLEKSVPPKSALHNSTKCSGSATRKAVTPDSDQTTSRNASELVPNIDPDDEPFRARPLRCLGLEHFKINPARNQGLDYAYDTVVRKKNERKCMSGCTRPGCCGDRFRAMARVGGIPGKSGAEQEEDRAILREFLGPNSQLLQNLSGEERENLLVEARARALANQYGRHRHTHQRAQSPPGFWRTDMPDTQEEEDDLEAAKKLEREKVEERYREAMRPGGLWTWADE